MFEPFETDDHVEAVRLERQSLHAPNPEIDPGKPGGCIPNRFRVGIDSGERRGSAEHGSAPPGATRHIEYALPLDEWQAKAVSLPQRSLVDGSLERGIFGMCPLSHSLPPERRKVAPGAPE